MEESNELLTFTWPYPQELHVLHLAAQRPQALAFEWIKAYIDQLNAMIEYDGRQDTLGYEEFIQITVDWYNASQDSNEWPDYLTKGGAFEGFSLDPLYWEKLSIFLDTPLKDEYCQAYFSCSC